jgi:hypothetical protein
MNFTIKSTKIKEDPKTSESKKPVMKSGKAIKNKRVYHQT